MRKRILLFLFLAILFAALYWFYSHSFIKVTAENSNGSENTFVITNQSNNKKLEIKTTANSIKRLLPRGNYEVTVKNSGSNFFVLANSPGFMRTNMVNGELKAEVHREFIGNNPSPCMLYTETLTSFSCSGDFNMVGSHIPASKETPTYVKKITEQGGYIKGSFARNNVLYFLVRTQESSDTIPAPHTLYTIRNNKVLVARGLDDLEANKSYKISPFKSGFVVYDESFDNLIEYESVDAKPKNVNITRPKDQDLTANSLQVSGDTIAITYLNKNDQEPVDAQEVATPKPLSYTLVLQNGGSQQEIKIKTAGSLELCGESLVCSLGNQILETYVIENNKPVLAFRILGALGVTTVGNNLLVMKPDGLLRFDPNSKTGYMPYTFGEYSYCGDTVSGNAVVLCLISSKSKKVALLINLDSPDMSEALDKKIAELEKMPDITSLSAYKNILYIAPNYGQVQYDVRSGGFAYNKEVQKAVDRSIDNKIAELGINTKHVLIIK